MQPSCTFFRRHPLLLCFLFFLALLYTFFYRFFAFLLASSPVLLLTAFLLGVVLFHSEPNNVPPEDNHVYKKINYRSTTTKRQRHFPRGSDSAASSDSDNPLAMSTATSLTSFPDDQSESESEPERPEEKQGPEEVVRVVAWTAEDDKSIENIGSLELERNATVEKLMSRRRASRQRHHADLIDLDDATNSKLSVHVTGRKNPFDLDVPYHEDDFPGSAPSMLRPSRNPFFDDDDDGGGGDDDLNLRLHAPPSSTSSPVRRNSALMLRRHESFTVGASDFRPSRFRPYFVTEKMQGQSVAVPEASGKSSSSSSSSSSAGASASREEETALAEAAMLEEKSREKGMVVAVDVELISDSSDDMSLPAGDDEQMKQQEVAVGSRDLPLLSDEEDDGESFEVESIIKQVAAAGSHNQDPAYDYSPSAGKVKQEAKAFEQPEEAVAVPPSKLASMRRPIIFHQQAEAEAEAEAEVEALDGGAWVPPSKLASMRRAFHHQDEDDEAWVAPSKLASVEEKETREKEVAEIREDDILAPPPPPPVVAAAAAPPPVASLKDKAVGKSSRYKAPSKKAVLGFFRK